MSSEWTRNLDEAGVVRLAELLALKLRRGDAVALSGDLGAGKTTLARALIRALIGDAGAEVPSPTFSLHQAYAAQRLQLSHFDFYRLSGAEEARELGFEEAIGDGAVVVEWPERAPELMPGDRFAILLEETQSAHLRRVTVRGHGTAAARAARIGAAMRFLERQAGWRSARIRHLQGDASARSYARLFDQGRTALFMDAPPQPDGPPIRDGRSYSRIAHLAEDMVRPFTALSAALRAAGLSAPAVLAADPDAGLALIEDLGDRVYSTQVALAALPQEELWRTAVDALIALHRVPVPAVPLPDYDREALQIEVELLLDWYWPALHGAPAPAAARAGFLSLWQPVFARLARQPPTLVLRDFHSPNLIWLPEREGIRRVGIIDFQDAQSGSPAYDLVSLLQDARVDVPESLERSLLARYLEASAARPDFHVEEFTFAYNALGLQRNTKILGIFVRLARRDGKRQYLAHVPRIWGYVERNLRHVALAPLGAWYDTHFPASVRGGSLPA
jgi:tRNA threonylcarbamoyl adenosine modification protein YjeE